MPEERPLRLLMTSYDYRPRLGGVATAAFETASALAALPNVEIKLIAPSPDQNFDAHGLFPTLRYPLSKKSPLASLNLTRHISRQIKEWKPDAIFNYLWLPCGVASWLCGGVPYYIFVHGVEILETDRSFSKKIRKAFSPIKNSVLKNAEALFVASGFTAKLLSSQCGIKPEKIRIIKHGVDTGKYFPTEKPSALIKKYSLGGKFVFLTLTRLEDYKGVDVAIQAFSKLVSTHPNVHYLVCGVGPDRSRLEALVSHLNLESHVTLAGEIPPDSERDYYNLADVFVLLSREDWVTPNFEGFGLVFLESAACGKPSIAGDSGGVPDAVENGVSGWLVPPQDIEKVAALMTLTVENPELVLQFGKNARKAALEKFRWSDVAEKIFVDLKKNVRN